MRVHRTPAGRPGPERGVVTVTNKVVVVGSANIDLVVTAARLPDRGETVTGRSLTRGLGGKGANQAVAAARAGADTVLVAATGDDEFSELVREGLRAEGINLSLLASRSAEPTGVALVTVDDAGANTIVVTHGANGLLDGDSVDQIAGLLEPGDVVLMQLEVPVEACSRAVAIAKSRGASAVLNAAPAPDAATQIVTLLTHLDLLIVNEVEAARLCGTPVDAITDWSMTAAKLRAMGPGAVVITLGERGAFLADDQGGTLIAAPEVAVIDTTGAGDTFCGYVASGLAAKMPLAASVRLACIAGALATTQLGAQTAIPVKDDVIGQDTHPADEETRCG